MGKVNRGKDFEERFRTDFARTFPNEFIYRLRDDVSMRYGTARNPCDFICHVNGKVFLVETKSHYGNTFPFSEFPQYDRLLNEYAGYKDVVRALVVWFVDHDEVIFVDVDEVERMKDDGHKSINIRRLDGYDVVRVPSQKMRIFLKSDYSFMGRYGHEGQTEETE